MSAALGHPLSPIPPEEFQRRLLAWFDMHGRKDLPWQQDINPYRVWVSEIMLQQTQVASVIGYYRRFMARFPNIAALAAADTDHVLQYWAGLGYYARARNLHKTAKAIAANGGVFPTGIEELSALPGIGRSTAGAILSIACGQAQPILDGNVKRVLSRFHAVPGWPGTSKVATQLWEIAGRYTPNRRCGAYTQAMMDLGATLCTRSKPQCKRCPVATGCAAYHANAVADYPAAKPRKILPVKRSYLLVLLDRRQRTLLLKRPPAGIWGGLWSLPEFDDLDRLTAWAGPHGVDRQRIRLLPENRHSFSHYHLDYIPVVAQAQNPTDAVMEANQALWYKFADFDTLGLPAPIKRLLTQLKEDYYG